MPAFAPTRDALMNLQASEQRVSEGDLAQVAAFVTIARNEGAESVNCGTVDGTDIHIALGPTADATEYAGIVAEMIPQLPRPAGWDAATLNSLHSRTIQMLVVAGLTYDNGHLVNADPAHPQNGQPKRMSLLGEIYDDAIEPAIVSCGLRPIRVDRVQHNGIVTDLILAEVRRAQVVIADVTLQRAGVYYEAGFANGLGRTVIWCCREDEIKMVHFDTRQYSHVVWSDAADLRTKLEARIRGTVTIPVTNS